jgi:hypothetical protein
MRLMLKDQVRRRDASQLDAVPNLMNLFKASCRDQPIVCALHVQHRNCDSSQFGAGIAIQNLLGSSRQDVRTYALQVFANPFLESTWGGTLKNVMVEQKIRSRNAEQPGTR